MILNHLRLHCANGRPHVACSRDSRLPTLGRHRRRYRYQVIIQVENPAALLLPALGDGVDCGGAGAADMHGADMGTAGVEFAW